MSTKKAPVYLASTEVPAHKSAAEIQQCLVKAGARQIANEYDSAGNITAMRFTLGDGPGAEAFSMPVRVEPVFKKLQAARRYPTSYAKIDRAQAERVAWRQLVYWLKAQLALIDLGMTRAGEVFFPYQLTPGTHHTMYQAYSEAKLLAAPEAPKQ